jgi:hypothetical protein
MHVESIIASTTLVHEANKHSVTTTATFCPLSCMLLPNTHFTCTRPIHVLGRGPHRLVYAAIYGVMSDLFVKIVLDGAGDYCTETSENPSTYELAFCDVGI